MKIKSIILLLAALFPVLAHSQTKGARGKYNWPAYTPIEIPDSLKSEDAFFIENVKYYEIHERFRTEIQVFKRIYINSESAAEDFSQQELFLGRSGQMSILKARTLKASGEVLDLDGDQIIETYSEKKNKYGSERIRRIQFVYPNVEVGDVIDMVYEVVLDGYIFSDLLYLEDEIPSLHSRVSMNNYSQLDLSVYRLNDAPPIESKVEYGSHVINWQSKAVKSIKTDYFNALPPDHPSLVFILFTGGQNLDYDTWFRIDAEDLPMEYDIFSSIEKMFLKQGIIQEEDPPFVQLQSAIHYFENASLWNYDEDIAVGKTLNHLVKDEVNRLLFMRYMMKFLKEKDIRYEKGFTKSLLKGRFEHGFVSLEQLTHRFLVIYDQNEQPHFLFPPRGKGQFYYLDEIPYYLEGNQSIALYGERDFLQEQATVELPESGSKYNMHSAQIKIKLNKGEALSNYSRKDKLSGHYSFLSRDRLGEIWKEELGIAPDSIVVAPTFIDNMRTKPVYPYQVEFNQEERSHAFFESIDDSIGWFDLSSVLPLGVYQDDELDAEFGDYLVLPFVKKHSISAFIQNDEQISIAEDIHSIELSNEVGTIEVKLYQLNDKVVKAKVTIETKKRYLKGADVGQFKELLQKYSEVRQKKWLLKM
ncbi:MAG: DUF3857 domain-containing protein [Crocinitomicaceae bacterium]|nr:DUF3857 domain-containing protein [Crocinitomicaceae bacterium]